MIVSIGKLSSIFTWCIALGALCAPPIRGADALETYQTARKAWQDGDNFGLQAAIRMRDESKPGPDPADLLAKQDQSYESAEKAFREALKADEKNALIKADLGRFLVERKRYREAADNLYLALQNPNSEKQISATKRSECLRVLGGLFERAGQSQRAITAYRQALEINPSDFKLALSFAGGLCTANQSEEAVAVLEPRLKEGAAPVPPAERALGLYTLAYAQEESGYSEEALLSYRLAYRLAKTIPDDSVGVKDQAQGAIRRVRNALQEIMEKEIRTRLDGYRRDGDDRLHAWFATQPDAVTYALKELKTTPKDEDARVIVAREPLAGILKTTWEKIKTRSPLPKDAVEIPPGEQFITMFRNMQKAAELEVAIGEWVKAPNLDQRQAIQQKEPFVSILKEVAQRRLMARQLAVKGLEWKRAALKDRLELEKAQAHFSNAKTAAERNMIEESEPLASLHRALHCFQDALQAYPYISRLHRELGFCYLALGDVDNSWIHFEAALAYDPLNPSVLSAQGEICMLKQDWEQGGEIFQKLESIDPENGPAYFGAARVGLFLRRTPKELETALDAFEKAELLGIFGPTVLDYRNKAQNLLTRMENGEVVQPEIRSREARIKAARKPSNTPDLLRNTLGE